MCFCAFWTGKTHFFPILWLHATLVLYIYLRDYKGDINISKFCTRALHNEINISNGIIKRLHARNFHEIFLICRFWNVLSSLKNSLSKGFEYVQKYIYTVNYTDEIYIMFVNLKIRVWIILPNSLGAFTMEYIGNKWSNTHKT